MPWRPSASDSRGNRLRASDWVRAFSQAGAAAVASSTVRVLVAAVPQVTGSLIERTIALSGRLAAAFR